MPGGEINEWCIIELQERTPDYFILAGAILGCFLLGERII